MLPLLKQAYISARDLMEQPPSRYVLLVKGAGGGLLPFAVDRVAALEHEVKAYLGEELVFAASPQAMWSLHARETLDVMTQEEHARTEKQEEDDRQAFKKVLLPDAPPTRPLTVEHLGGYL